VGCAGSRLSKNFVPGQPPLSVRGKSCFSRRMPILIAPCVGLLFGVLFAWIAREDLARSERGPLGSTALILTVAFGFLIHGPVAGYFIVYAPDWSVAYLIDSQRLPTIVDMLSLLLTAASPTIGYFLAIFPASRRDGTALLRWTVPLLVLVVAVTIVLGPRLGTEANYVQYRGSFGTRSVAGGGLGMSLLWMNAVLFCSAGWVAKSLRQLGQRARD
jgi:hypothetical protein